MTPGRLAATTLSLSNLVRLYWTVLRGVPPTAGISVCTLVLNGLEFTEDFITSIRSPGRGVDELVIVDNGSDHHVADYLASQADKYHRFADNQGFGAGFNKAVTLCENEYVLLTNNDTVWPATDWPTELVREFEALKNCGLLFPCVENILLPVNLRQRRGPRLLKMPRWRWPLCSGAAIFTKKSIFEQVGGFSSQEFWVSGEDLDLQCKIWDAGYDIYVTERIFVRHLGKATAMSLPNRQEVWDEGFARFRDKWEGRLRGL
ncbi:MAG: glycosyltransferase [Thermoleophilia bacterium]|nr:glycosyltransferase [Thermoleophilia bacterium]